MKEEFISPKVFRLRLQISKTLFKKYVREEVIRLDRSKPIGKTWKLEWYANRDRVIKQSSDPTRYTPEAIQQRKERKSRKQFAQEDAVDEAENGVENNIDDILEAEEPDDVDGEFSSAMSKREADAVKKLYDAKRAKLAYLKEAGILVESAVVVREWEQIAITVRKAVMSISDRVCQLFASMQDANEIKQMLDDEHVHALSRLHYEVKVDAGEASAEILED